MSKLKSFLRKSKEFLENYQNKNHNFTSTTINIVMGNQACDADSMISSLCYAYYKDMMMNNNHDHANIHYLPIMSISREDIYFRREVKILLELIDVSFDDLICVNECPFENFYQENLLKLTLMDHNYLASQLHSRYSSAVTEIVDHHADQGHYPSVEGVNRLIAFNSQISKAEVGSACTLVAERISQANLIDSTIATLLLGVISVE